MQHSYGLKKSVEPIDIIALLYCSTLFEIWGALRVPIELMCMACFILSRFGGIRLGIKNKYFLWAIFFSVTCLFSAMYAVNTREALLGTRMYFETCLAGICLMLYITTKERLVKLLKYILTCAIIFFFFLILTNPIEALMTNRQIGSINANSVGMKMAICAMIAVWLFKERKMSLMKLCFALAVLTPAIMVSGSKKAIFILVFGLGLLMLLYQKNILRIIGYVLLAILVLYGVYMLIMENETLYSLMGRRVEGLLNAIIYGYERGDLSTKGRIDMIQLAIDEWKLKPFFGYGINNYGIYNGLAAYGSVNMYSHCNYTELLFGVGTIGTVIYYSIFPWLLSKQIKAFRNDSFQKLFLSITIMILVLDIGMVSYMDEFIQAQIVLASACCAISLEHNRKKYYE